MTVIFRTADAIGDLPSLHHVSLDVTTDEIDASLLPDRIDGFEYCPGSMNLGPVRGLKPTAMVDDYQLNVVGAVKCLQAALPAMEAAERSSMVKFSTVAVSQGLTMHAFIAAAKGAVEGLTRSLAAELAPKILETFTVLFAKRHWSIVSSDL